MISVVKVLLKEIVKTYCDSYIAILGIERFANVDSHHEVLVHHRHDAYTGTLVQFLTAGVEEVT